jgi:hypothetical protein
MSSFPCFSCSIRVKKFIEKMTSFSYLPTHGTNFLLKFTKSSPLIPNKVQSQEYNSIPPEHGRPLLVVLKTSEILSKPMPALCVICESSIGDLTTGSKLPK